MASTLALGPVITAILAALRASVALTTYVGARVYPDDNGDAPSILVYPYVQVESSGEVPFNTLGEPSAAKWGGLVRVHVRVGSQSRTDAQANSMTSVVKQVLDGQSLTVAGYPFADVAYEDLAPMRDATGGKVTREWVSTYEVMVHQ